MTDTSAGLKADTCVEETRAHSNLSFRFAYFRTASKGPKTSGSFLTVLFVGNDDTDNLMLR